jgi:hypothetical protein
MANRYSIPTLMSAIAQPAFTGITAQAIIARPKVSIGAIRNSNRLAPAGMIVSFMIIFSASANGCSRPKGPTTLGPLRSCIAASTLRSA